MELDVAYNKDLLLAGVGRTAWLRMGPERWFTDYKIVCADKYDSDAPYIIALPQESHLGPLTHKRPPLIQSSSFLALATTGALAKYRFILYKPIAAPTVVGPGRFIVNDLSCAKFENKCVFRELFSKSIAIPEHQIVSYADLFALSAADAYARFSGTLGNKIVLQDETNSGGRGTCIVEAQQEMDQALQLLRQTRMGDACVVSRFVEGIERSIQVAITASGLVQGPLQQQLVRHPELCNPAIPGALAFCGGRLISDVSPAVQSQISNMVQVIGDKLRTAGYKGIFGVDFLVDPQERVFALEINARITGMLPLVNEQNATLPLYLLHILELAGEPYTVTTSRRQGGLSKGPRSFLVFYNTNDAAFHFDATITTANYRLHEGRLQKISDEPHWQEGADVLLQLECSPQQPAAPGKGSCVIFLRADGFADNGELSAEARQVLTLLRRHQVTV